MKKIAFASIVWTSYLLSTSMAMGEISQESCVDQAQHEFTEAGLAADELLVTLSEGCEGPGPTHYADKCYARVAQKVKLALIAAQKDFQEALKACQSSSSSN